MTDEVFTLWVQENRPLSLYLRQGSRSVIDEIERCRSTDDLDRFEADLRQQLGVVRLEPPGLGGARPDDRQGEGVRRQVSPGTSVPTTRHYVAVQVIGYPEVLRYWPDAESSLTPLDSEPGVDTPAGWTRPHEIWTQGTADDQHALYTYVDLTEDEEAQAGDRVNRIANARIDRIRPIVAAIAAQMTAYFDTELPAMVADRLAKKRQVLVNRQAVTESLTFPSAWVPEEPTLAPATTTTTSEPPPVPMPASGAQSLNIEHAPPLSSATFESVQKIIRAWADAVERTPAAFSGLAEDRLSDLLAATLNATVPFAGREIYTRGGKSDIYIMANILDKGLGPAKVFVCESKFARSNAIVREALDPQLFGYLNTDDTAAVLILFFQQQNFASVRDSRLEALREVAGYISEEIGPVEGWPVMRFEREGRKVDICIALIKVPLAPGAASSESGESSSID